MLSGRLKLFFLIGMLMTSVIGFMVKLPRIFHQMDKELHALFYCCCFLFCCLLYPKRWFSILLALTFFGFAIEWAQDFSNKISIRLVGKRIHGRFDPEDIKYNLIGLFIGLLIFGCIRLLTAFQQKVKS